MIDIILLILGITLLLMLLIRYKLNIKTEILHKADMGGAMTIGTREVQEDCYLLKETNAGRLIALADGMGEVYAGRIASRTTIDTISDIFASYNTLDNPQYFFKKAFNCANKEVLKALDKGHKGSASLGSAIVYNNKLFYAVVGNIKVCVYRNGDLIPVSTGHTVSNLAQKSFVNGNISREDAIKLLENKRLYNYLGQDGFEEIEIFDEPIELNEQDIIVMMSDGVYELILWEELEETIKKGGTCEQMALEIIEKINKNPEENKDNASILFLRTGDIEV